LFGKLKSLFSIVQPERDQLSIKPFPAQRNSSKKKTQQ